MGSALLQLATLLALTTPVASDHNETCVEVRVMTLRQLTLFAPYGQCSVPDCLSPSLKRGMCGMHYQRVWKHGDAGHVRHPDSGGVCHVPGCDKPTRSRSAVHCEMHYGRSHRRGTTERLLNEIVVKDDLFVEPTADAAWLLGLIWSDGCIRGSNINIVSADRPLIDCAARVLGLVNGIYQRSRSYAFDIRFTSHQMADDLRRFGLCEAKSLIIGWPKNLSDEHFWPFVRGVFDGDGCIHLRQVRPNQAAPDATLDWSSGSPAFATALAYALAAKGVSSKTSVRYHPWCDSTVYRIIVRQQASLRVLYEGMYPNADVPCLPRKRDLLKRWYETPRGRAGNPVLRARGEEQKAGRRTY